jgi:7,8-dihydroneopterin aldolase/epimerase/oxygenase
MSDQIFIKGLSIHAHHGVLEYEGKVGQRFVIDLELSIDLGNAAKSDRIADTISYARAAEVAQRAFTDRAFKLIEAAAGAVADAILAEFSNVAQVRVVVHKPHAPIAAIFDDVGVALTRRREG